MNDSYDQLIETMHRAQGSHDEIRKALGQFGEVGEAGGRLADTCQDSLKKLHLAQIIRRIRMQILKETLEVGNKLVEFSDMRRPLPPTVCAELTQQLDLIAARAACVQQNFGAQLTPDLLDRIANLKSAMATIASPSFATREPTNTMPAC